MELDELKAGWNMLNSRLAESELVNLRIVKEMIAQKTRTAFDNIYKLNLHNLFVYILIICFVFPFIYMQTPISTTSFVIVETLLVIGLVPLIQKLLLLSEFDLEGKECKQLCGLMLRYKQACHREKYWAMAVVCLAMVAFYISELVFNKKVSYAFDMRILLTVGGTVLTFVLAFFIGQCQRKRHAQEMLEIKRGLEELREFEN